MATTRSIRNSPGLLFTGAIGAGAQVETDCFVPPQGCQGLKFRIKSDQAGQATILRADALGTEAIESGPTAVVAGTELSLTVADPMATPHFARLTNSGGVATTAGLTSIEVSQLGAS